MSFQVTRIVVIGDSHVRRMVQHRQILDRKNGNNTTVDFIFRGGAHLSFVEDQLKHIAHRYHILIVMAGGNDLSSGALRVHFQAAYDRIANLAFNAGIKVVAIPSLWPRQSGIFNRAVQDHSYVFGDLYRGNPQMVFWQWDRRQPLRTYDGVHLFDYGYRRSISYLFSLIRWTIKNRLR